MFNDEKRGKLICELRKEKKLTQKELGDLINYTDKNISKWERGISFPNNPNVINKLAEIFEVSVEELMYGELKQETNEREIRENFVEQFKNNYNKYRKNMLTIIISFLSLIIIGLVSIYVIFIKNSVSVYSIALDNTDFEELNSTLVITNKINILNLNQIVSKSGRDIKSIRLYYIDKYGNKHEVLNGENSVYYIEEKRNYGVYSLEKLIKNRTYIEVGYKDSDSIDKVEIKFERKYINDNIFPKPVDPIIESKKEEFDEQMAQGLLILGFLKRDYYYEKELNQDTIITFDIDSMNLTVSIINNSVIERIYSNYNTNSIMYEKMENGEISQTEELKVLELKNCEIEKCNNNADYAMYLNFIKNKLK